MALVDRYQLLQWLGAGSFGEAWRASDRASGRIVAVKILHRKDYDSIRRFHREAVVLHSQLGNEFVIELIDHQGLNDPEPYLVLEYCDLGSLRSWVEVRRGWRDVAVALLHAAKGLAGLHRAGGYHRDVKPENLLWTRTPDGLFWKVKLADFGIAGFPDPATGTMTRSAAGTAGYIAPELYLGAEFHERADVYALGITGVELLTGRIGAPSILGADAPIPLKSLLQAMITGLPTARPTAEAVVDVIESLLSAPPAEPPAPRRPNNTLGPTLAGAATFLAAMWGIGKLIDHSQTYYDPSVDRNRGPDGRFR